jgi:hypothetical protein
MYIYLLYIYNIYVNMPHLRRPLKENARYVVEEAEPCQCTRCSTLFTAQAQQTQIKREKQREMGGGGWGGEGGREGGREGGWVGLRVGGLEGDP